MEKSADEIEINFRLDANGRTVEQQSGNTSSLLRAASVDYQTQTVPTTFSLPPADNNNSIASWSEKERLLLDELLYDCEIADSGLMPRTFWVSSTTESPRFSLEQIALDIFHHHVRPSNEEVDDGTTLRYDPQTSGAEWWVQLRPSPEKTGRYAMHNNKTEDGNQDDDDDAGISFHWDKDEELRLLMGGTTYIHPHLSTVTYLTSLGAPTVTVDCRIHSLTGKWIVPQSMTPNDISNKNERSKNDDECDQRQTDSVRPSESTHGFVSWPSAGKHLSFDGRFLHAAPSDLMKKGAFAEQRRFDAPEDASEHKRLQRRHRRVTLLVNVWLNYRPFDVKPFPDTMVDKMSGHHGGIKARLSFPSKESSKDIATTRTVKLISGKPESKATTSVREFTWPMGACVDGQHDEVIRMQVPLEAVQSAADHGGNVQIEWQRDTGTSETGPAGFSLEIVDRKAGSKRQKLTES